MQRPAEPGHSPEELYERATRGDDAALGELLERQRAGLRGMVARRLDADLRARIGASDVVQDALLEACARFPRYAREPRIPFLAWLRLLTAQRLRQLRRFHLGAQARDVRRELRAHDATPPSDASSTPALHAREQSSPTQRLARAEESAQLRDALARLAHEDREVLVMRHFAELTAEQAGAELDISTAGAAKRYLRALQRLRESLERASTEPPR